MTINALMIGTGEYTTGFVHGAAATSDKGVGVVALTLMDLRRQQKIDHLSIAGTNGTRFPGLRQHLQQNIGDVYRDMSTELDTFPDDTTACDPQAWQAALATMSRGDVVTIFTPDDTHFEMALKAVQHGCHVLVAKPVVKTLAEHSELATAAIECGVLVAVEVHKRWDPVYIDARDRIRMLGDFSFFQSYMSQPKSQLDTFRSWAGTSSDISYYLNTHHIDFHHWAVSSFARPRTVRAVASNGWAHTQGLATEDSITLVVEWENTATGHLGTGVYTSSWIAPRSDVHSQQRFFYQGHGGEISVDQAHRGYSIATDADGYRSANPLFMKYTPDAEGFFAGQGGYGYRSIADFVGAAASINSGCATPTSFDHKLATVQTTIPVTAILEAGRTSLDQRGAIIELNV